ncbi:MAG: NB-ARC domain-containing protein [Gemmatimonadaceae bacterium]|nr:NB-ARC domain-containing protein [Gemmatimonadaceae bacterium]
MRRHGGRFYRTVLHDDGKLGQTFAEGTHVVHLHGYWHGSDTLHTPQQLLQPRPHLRRSLEGVVEASVLVVVGYSGWDDVITETLIELLSDSGKNPEILWAFHQSDRSAIEASNRQLLSLLSPGIGRGRVALYRGIECRALFSQVLEQLRPSYRVGSPPASEPRMKTVVREDSDGNSGPRQIRIEIDFPLPQQVSSDSDSPLIVSPWVGRGPELAILANLNQPIAFITGLGGQGKSALAGQFLQEQAISSRRFTIWDWRDCREESDRLSTQILRLVERLSNGAIDASRVEVTDISAVVGMLFQVLQDRTALLVFDNVDQYVDLESLEPTKGLEVLISEAHARSHQSLFLFTCRPDVRIDESRAIRVPLSGLSEQETKDLVAGCGIPRRDWDLSKELHQRTEGHPLWVRLVTMQAVRDESGLRGALDLISQGEATLPDTTRSIWAMLSDQQRDVLRTMAELDRPEPEMRLLDLLPGRNANRVNRALKTLRSFHLIETRTQPEGEPLLGLHPIIREFVRTSFPTAEREKYIGAILSFLDQMIGRFKPLLPQEPSYDILEHWARKAELQITLGRFEEATVTIDEIALPLINRGYVEEMVRIGMNLFRSIDWAVACSSYKPFDSVFQTCLTQMVQIGHSSTGGLLERYEEAIPGKSAQFILLCDLRCYADWYAGDYEAAIHWGEEGERLKKSTSVDTVFSTRHNLALALRDAGRVPEALERFLDSEPLQAVIAPGERIPGKEEHFYGNIGRCLYLGERWAEALICYVKSAQLLEGSRSPKEHLNKGYIRYWIGELLVHQGQLELAAACYRAAMCKWTECSPPRASQASEKLDSLIAEHPELHTYADEPDWKVEEAYGRWLDRQ